MTRHRCPWSVPLSTLALVLLASVLGGACSVHVGTAPNQDTDASTYSSTWRRDVSGMNEAEPAMAACQGVTGDGQRCIQADEAMEAAVQHLVTDLGKIVAPLRYYAGHSAMLPALRQLVAALHLRDSSLRSHDAAGLEQSLQMLRAAGANLTHAASLYPTDSGVSVNGS